MVTWTAAAEEDLPQRKSSKLSCVLLPSIRKQQPASHIKQRRWAGGAWGFQTDSGHATLREEKSRLKHQKWTRKERVKQDMVIPLLACLSIIPSSKVQHRQMARFFLLNLRDKKSCVHCPSEGISNDGSEPMPR